MLKISIITVAYNSAATITETLRSVAGQLHPSVEHIVVDGASIDETADIVRREGSHVARFVSEPDHGIYDAMNKGLSLATGDLVGFLNSDDTYADPSVLTDVAELAILNGQTCGFVYGDIEMLDSFGRVARVWKMPNIGIDGITAMQIPHPAFFVRRSILQSIDPPFDASYRICADIKQQLLVVNRMHTRGAQLSRPLVRMRLGGRSTSTLSNYLLSWRESQRAWNEVMGQGGVVYTLRKVLWKLGGVRLRRTRKTEL